MKVSMIAVATDQPELHHSESSETGDPTMAFLAVLGELLPKLPANPVVEVPAGKAGIAKPSGITPGIAAIPIGVTLGVMIPSGVTLGIAAPSATGVGVVPADGPIAVAGTATPTATIPVQAPPADAVTPTATGHGLMSGSPKAAIPNPGTVPEHPLIAADRAGLSIVNGPAVVLGPSPSVEPTAVHVVPTGSTPPVPALPKPTPGSPKVSVSDPSVDPAHPLIASNGAGLPVTDGPVGAQEVTLTPLPVSGTPLPVSGPVQDQDQPSLDPAVHEIPSPGHLVDPGHSVDRGLEHAKSSPTAAARAGDHQAEPVSINLAAVATPARSEPALAMAAPVSERPQVAAQLAPYVTSLRHGSDGMHQITVVLHPADLGQVQVVVELRNGTVHLQLTGAHEAAREALSGALPQLRRELTDAGLSVGRTDVLSQGSGTAGGGTTGGNSGHGAPPSSGFSGAVGERPSSGAGIEPSLPPVRHIAHAGVLDVNI